jgi:hypothetical protein
MLVPVAKTFFSPSAFQASLQTSTVQVSNRTNGAAMGLIKKVDVKAYFAARRGLRVAAAEQATKRVKAIASKAKPAPARITSAEFLRDFCLEHTLRQHSNRAAFVPLVAGRAGSPSLATAARNLDA